jgi:hypothetical protein
LLNRLAAHLASAVSAMDYIGPLLYADLSFVDARASHASVTVKRNLPVLAVDNYVRCVFLNDKPLLEVSFPPVQVSLIAGFQTFFSKLLSYLSTRNPLGESFHHFDDTKVNFAGLAFASHGGRRYDTRT